VTAVLVSMKSTVFEQGEWPDLRGRRQCMSLTTVVHKHCLVN